MSESKRDGSPYKGNGDDGGRKGAASDRTADVGIPRRVLSENFCKSF